MATEQDVIDKANAEVGYTESPRGSNRTKYGREARADGLPWCAIFIWWIFMLFGIDLRKYSDNPWYTPNLFADLKALGWAVKLTELRMADIVFYDFPDRVRRIQHVEIFWRWVDKVRGFFKAIGGNTGIGNDSNGGKVMVRDRTTTTVAGAIRIPFLNRSAIAAANNTLAELQKVIFYAKTFHLGGPGDTNPAEAVKILQVGLNRWADQFAAMAHQPNPPDIPVDGMWNQTTWDAVTAVQQLTGRNDGGNPGTVGPNTWATLYP